MNETDQSSFELKNNELQIQKDTSLPEKIPQTNEEKYSKLNELIEHMEFNIDHNRKRCNKSSLDVYTLFRSTELLAFDILFANYLLGDANPSEIYEFFEHCTIPQFDLSSGKMSSFEKAQSHIKYLQELIEKWSNIFFKIEPKQFPVPKRVSEFGLYLQNQKIRLDHQLARKMEADKQKSLEEETKKEENEIPDLSGLPPSFTKWLTSELKVGLTPDQESIEIHCLIKSITSRLKSIAELNERIRELEEEVENSTKEEVITEHLIKEADNSPYMINARRNCQFLYFILDMLHRQENLIQKLIYSFDYCRDRLSDLTETAQRSIDEMTTQMNKMKDVLNKKQLEVSAIEQELQPFITLYYTQTRVAPISLPPQQSYQKLDEMLNMMISQNPQNAEARRNDQKNLYELQSIRNELHDMGIKLGTLHKQIEDNDRAIFEAAIEHSKNEEEFMLQEQEAEQLKRYEAGLNEVQQLLKFNEMSEWFKKLRFILANLDQIVGNQEILLNEAKKQVDVSSMEDLINTKRKQIKNLSEINYRMNTEIARSNIELAGVKEEKYHAKMDLSLNNDFVPDCVEDVQKHKKMVMCPVCKKNRRNVFLVSCKHAVCSECLHEAKVKCPLCGVQFERQNVRPFFIQ